MKNKSMNKTKREIKHLRLFKQSDLKSKCNRIGPTNDFPEFKKEEIRQSIIAVTPEQMVKKQRIKWR